MRTDLTLIGERVWANALRAAPLSSYTRLLRLVGDIPLPLFAREMIWRAVGTRMGMNLAEAELALSEYRTFRELFVRRLRAGQRPITGEGHAVVSPVDAQITWWGQVDPDTELRIKGQDYNLKTFLGDAELARRFEGGTSFTLYLRPHDYHRIHCPIRARVTGLRRIPGRVLPVKPFMMRHVRGLLAGNTRLILELQGELGRAVMVCVAAAGVGTISSRFDGEHPGGPVSIPSDWIERGDELAAFQIGSTVVLLFERGQVIPDNLHLDQEIRVGEPIGRFLPLNADATTRGPSGE